MEERAGAAGESRWLWVKREMRLVAYCFYFTETLDKSPSVTQVSLAMWPGSRVCLMTELSVKHNIIFKMSTFPALGSS